MGCCISFSKNKRFKIKEESPLLATNKYCNNCETNFLFNEYYKHLPECSKKTRETFVLYGGL